MHLCICLLYTVTTNAPAPLLDFKVCRRTNFKLCKLSNFCHRSRWGKKAYHWWWMHRFFMKFCTFGEISWLRLIFLFKSVAFFTTLHIITLAAGLRHCSYLKEFLEDPQSFPVDWVFPRWSQYLSLVLHSPGVHIRMASFTSRCASFTPLVVNQMSFSDVPEFFSVPETTECQGFQHLEMTSLWREFCVSWRTCAVWFKMCDFGFRICDCELCDNDTIDSYKECWTHTAPQ